MTKTEMVTTLIKCAATLLENGDVASGSTLTKIAQSVDETLVEQTLDEPMPDEDPSLGLDFSSLGKHQGTNQVVKMKTPEPAIVEQLEAEARGEVPATFNVMITGFNVQNFAKAQQTMDQLKQMLRKQTGNEDIVVEITNVKLNK